MRIILDETKIDLDVKKVATDFATLYELYKYKTIPIGKSGKLDLSRKSVLRIALKSALVPVVLPLLRSLYASKGLELTPHEKHADLIDYSIHAFLQFIQKIEGDVNVYIKSDQDDTSNIRRITAISTYGPITINTNRTPEEGSEET